jgi:DNA-binding NarL/FixJ family response regulator
VRVAIGEDSVLLREGIARILAEAGFEVVAQAGDAEELVRKVRAHKPDVAVIDIRMPPSHSDEGLRAAREIRAALPEIGILVLSQYVDEHYALALLADGAEGVGYLLKDRIGEVDRFVDSVRRVGARGSVLDPEVVAHMVGRKGQEGPLADLTPRERDVLKLMAQGLSNRAICSELVITERAVEHHVTSIFTKLDLPASGREHRRVLAVLAFLQS